MDMENEIWSIMNQNLDLEPMKKRREDWIQLDNKIKYAPVNYAYYFIEYQNLYYSEVYEKYIDFSVVIYSPGKKEPIGVWPLCIYMDKDKNMQVGSMGGEVLPPLLISDIEGTELSTNVMGGGDYHN